MVRHIQLVFLSILCFNILPLPAFAFVSAVTAFSFPAAAELNTPSPGDRASIGSHCRHIFGGSLLRRVPSASFDRTLCNSRSRCVSALRCALVRKMLTQYSIRRPKGSASPKAMPARALFFFKFSFTAHNFTVKVNHST